MWKGILFFFALLRTSIRATISKRGAFLVEMALMLANNLIFFVMWWIFFRQFNDVGGWQFQDMAALMAVGTGGYGLMLICFGGAREIARMIVSGDLDAFMTQPKNLLLHVVASRSHAKGWGHIMTAVFLVPFVGIATPQTVALVTLGMVTGCLVFTAYNIIVNSFPFWMGPVESLSKRYADSLFLFAVYPTNIYSGLLQVVMFTVIPAGVIGYFPVELIRHFSWSSLVVLLASVFALCVSSIVIFYAGLKKYESGNRFGVRL